MFDSLTNRLGETIKKLRSQARLSEDNMRQTLREVRRALLEADVGLEVIKVFLADIQKRYEGEQVAASLTPAQQLIKIIQQELQALLGQEQAPLNLAHQPPVVILMAGLQGVGKTTTAAKLANQLKQQKKKVLLASADVYRPAAIEQLRILAASVAVDFFDSPSNNPIDIVNQAKQHAKQYLFEVLIVDTAGRLSIDEKMMAEISTMQQQLKPQETLLVADSQQGQDAVTVAKTFSQKLDLTGLVFTKVDGDARGGAILSVCQVTGKPIKLMAVGERMQDLQVFHPQRIAARILGMGDMLGLIEQIEQHADHKSTTKMVKKMHKGEFDFNDMLDQLNQMDKMGGMQAMLNKLPAMGRLQPAQVQQKSLHHQRALIFSMTPTERANPAIIKGSRRRRIAQGAGLSVQQVNQLLKQQKEMKTMLKRVKNKAFMNQLQGMMKKGGF